MSRLTLSFKSKVLRVYPLQQGPMEIGSDESCTVHIDSLAVEPKHARIETHGADSIVFDLNTESGTFVNQERVQEQKLNSGDIIRVGKHTLVYTYEEVSHLDANESSTSIDIHPVIEEIKAKEQQAQQESESENHFFPHFSAFWLSSKRNCCISLNQHYEI